MVRIIPLKTAVFCIALVAISACTSQYRNHGYVPTDAELAEIVVGVDSRDSVAETIGKPSTGGVLNDSGYYYIRSQVRHYGARRPEIIERQLVAITFDKRGTVQNIERYALEDGVAVALSRRVTDNGFDDKTFLRQILGNFGNFDPSSVLR